MKQERQNILWYRKPAEKWIEALPLGNGRIGAMVYGGGTEERIQIDESSFWSGEPSEKNNRPGTRRLMEEIREALLMQDYDRADLLGHDFVGNKNQYGTNMPVGELKLSIIDPICQVSDLVRCLDLREGIAVTEFDLWDNSGRVQNHVIRECFVSNPDQVFVLKMKAERKLSLRLRFDGIGNNTRIQGLVGTTVRIQGDAREILHSNGTVGVHLEGCMKLLCDGTMQFEQGEISVKDVTWLQIFLDLETTMFQKDPYKEAETKVLCGTVQGYKDCLKRHREDVRTLFDRMELSLGGEEKNDIPTDERIQAMARGEMDLALCALMYQYGRYLLIASSRENSPLPTHMGGIWNDNIYNNIDCTQDMHIDMNLQMQYWAAAMCHLPECYEPFFRYIENILMPSGEKTAREAYEAEGWTAHVVSNPWGFTSLGWAYNWGAWSLGGAWCAAMVWDYYEYTGDLEFLRLRGLPMVEGAVRFVLDYVFQDPESGYYMTGPSYSPENQFAVNGRNYFLALSNTCDIILVRELLQNYLEICEVLPVNLLQAEEKQKHVQNDRFYPEEGSRVREQALSLKEKCQEVLQKLPPYQIGKKGQLQEWFYDFDEPIPNHRHTSHLLGLYPFHQIEPEKEPLLAAAAMKTIELRHEDFEITSWGMNMLLGYYGRLGQGQNAEEILREVFARIVRPNLASVMADGDTMWMGTWELDGNTGLTAAMTELLVQSHRNEICLLPALPPSWEQTGYLKGVRLMHCGSGDLFWEKGELKSFIIHPERDGEWILRYHENTLTVRLQKDQDILVASHDFHTIK